MGYDTSAGSSDEIWFGAHAVRNGIGAHSVRQVYHLHETRQIPSFKIGRVICLHPVTWRERVKQLEREAQAS